jgi:hypothetical protein
MIKAQKLKERYEKKIEAVKNGTYMKGGGGGAAAASEINECGECGGAVEENISKKQRIEDEE